MSRKCMTLVAAGMVAACAESAVVEPDQSAATALRSANATPALAASPSRPLRGTCTFAATPAPPVAGQPPNVVVFLLDEVCHLAHLGLSTASAQETVTFTETGTSGVFATTYTAANGDQLFTTASVTGALVPDQSGLIHFGGTETVTGGTGRFAGASGSFSLVGNVSVAALTGEIELSGSLSY